MVEPKEVDYVVLGSGAAGSTCAFFLSQQGYNVVVCDIGSLNLNVKRKRKPPPYVRKRTSWYIPAYSDVFGGNTQLWSGKLYLVSDAETTDWPVSHDELLRFSKQLAREMNLNHDFLYRKEQVTGGAFFHRSMRSRLGNTFDAFNLEFNPLVEVQERKTVSSATFDTENKKISTVTVGHGKHAQTFLLRRGVIAAAGGLGNISLLSGLLRWCPWIEKEFPKSFPLADHRHVETGLIDPRPHERLAKGYLKNNREGFEDCLVVHEGGQMFAVQLDGRRRSLHRLKTKFLGEGLSRLALMTRVLERILENLMTSLASVARRRTSNLACSLGIFFADAVETGSRVWVVPPSTFRGTNLPRIDISYKPNRLRADQVFQLVRRYFNKRVSKLRPHHLRDSATYVGLHPSCSTPMRKHPNAGEIGTDMRVAGLKNLFVLGSNVFPSNGVTNPTWTIMVLAYRLARSL